MGQNKTSWLIFVKHTVEFPYQELSPVVHGTPFLDMGRLANLPAQ
jgi:hypothetical protein